MRTRGNDSSDVGLPEKQFSPILKKSKNRLELLVGNLIHAKHEELLGRQTEGGIRLLRPEVVRLGYAYRGRVREATAEFAEDLGDAVGRRQGFGKQQRRWTRTKIRQFLVKNVSEQAAQALFYKAFGLFTLANPEEAEKWLVEVVTPLGSSGLPSSTEEKLEFAAAKYPPVERRVDDRPQAPPSPAPGDKLADPIHFPTMTIREVRQLVPKSRSTIYRWLDEGKLKRADLGAAPGKRSSCLIRTDSVQRLLDEKQE